MPSTFKIMKCFLITFSIAASISLVSLRSEGKETPVKLESLPAPLQKTIVGAVGKGKIQTIVSEVEDKQIHYEVVVMSGKKKLEHNFPPMESCWRPKRPSPSLT